MSDKIFVCPLCKKAAKRDNKAFPFCSDRCQLIDLGNWSAGSYSIADDSTPFSDVADQAVDDSTLH